MKLSQPFFLLGPSPPVRSAKAVVKAVPNILILAPLCEVTLVILLQMPPKDSKMLRVPTPHREKGKGRERGVCFRNHKPLILPQVRQLSDRSDLENEGSHLTRYLHGVRQN